MAAVCVFCGSSRILEPPFLELAAKAGRMLAEHGHTVVSGGGRVGMMGTLASGARSVGGHTIGVMPEPMIPWEIADTEADAFLILPGGLGTLDELFEVWTLATLGMHDKPVVLLGPGGFYDGLLDWLSGLVPLGFVRPEALAMLTVVDSLEAALDALAPA
jgi:predicted Rossmann-fold nucleotide-binding protein